MRTCYLIRCAIEFKKIVRKFWPRENRPLPYTALRLSRYDISKAPFQARRF